MSAILVILAFFAGFGYITEQSISYKNSNYQNRKFVILMLTCFFVKVFLAALYYGHSTDMGCFSAWSEMAFDLGLNNFYTSDAFTDYPPGYIYVLYVLGALRNVFDISDSIYNVVLKLPAIICDMFIGCLIYKCTKNKMSEKSIFLLSGIYMLNPAVIVNSSLWGQVDSIYTAGIITVLLLLCNKKIIQSFFVFSLCIFIKPQSLIFTPVLVFAVAEELFKTGIKLKSLINVFAGALGALILMVLMAVPFGINNVANQYLDTIKSYPYMTVNAFNIWGALGQNWTELTPYFSALGYIFIVLITLFSARIFFVNKNKERFFLTAGFLSFATFMLSVKMHDRYAYPAIAMLIFGFIFSQRKKIFKLFILTSISQFFNMAWVLFIYEKNINYYAGSVTVVIASVVNILLFLYMSFVLAGFKLKSFSEYKELKGSRNINKTDALIILSITVVYSVFAFFDLGEMKAPQTSAEISSEEYVEIMLEKEEEIGSVFYYLGADAIESDFSISYYDKDENEVLVNTIESGNAFYWNESIAGIASQRIVIGTTKENIELFEVVLKNKNGVLIPKSCNRPELVDESGFLPERVTFRNSTYFDEIYHARTGYEFVKGKTVYEWTHPPLGKVFIALGIKLFKMTPFGWRIIGTLFGILMIPVMYILIKRIFKESFLACIGCIMLTFDFMHFSQTRISTIDVYVTFFIMLMYLFMYKYYTMNLKKATLKESFIPLLLSGICFGIGVACKWTAIYACAGLAIIFCITVFRQFKANEKGFFSWFFKTAVFCVLVFILIPVVIYCLSYIPYLNAQGEFSLQAIWENQKAMFEYHSKTVVESTHPYSSRWFSWPIVYKPLWYYSGSISDSIKEGISAFGNPVVWWAGIPSFVGCLYFAGVKKSKKALFLLIGYLSCLLPWVFVERTTYIYHYFPCVPFSVLMTCFCINKLDFKYKRYTGIGIGIVTVVLFLMFYPVLSGEPVATAYVDKALRWFSSWVLVG